MERLFVAPGRLVWKRADAAHAASRRKAVAALRALVSSRLTALAAILGVTAGVLVFELRTSWLEARVLAAAAAHLTFTVQPGPSPTEATAPSPQGPFDARYGYARLPDFLARLRLNGYDIVAQARSSALMVAAARSGVFPPYAEKVHSGLTMVDRHGLTLVSVREPSRIYRDFDEIPPLVIRTLLFVENRDLDGPARPYRNPAIEWNRFVRALADLGWSFLDPRHPVSGGSTLATQLEKIRHSPQGRTASVAEKGRQILSASLRAYRDGRETLAARRRIVCDYVNSIPLGARPSHGEVHGLGDGLWAWYGAEAERVNALLGALDRADREAHAPTAEQARAYRQVLSLLLASRRPAAYLGGDWAALNARTDAYLRLLSAGHIISPRIRDEALAIRLRPVPAAPAVPAAAEPRKAVDGIRAKLASLVGVDDVYALDRLDLDVATTLDGPISTRITHALRRLAEPSEAAAAGLVGDRLLAGAGPSAVVYSFTLYERGDGLNFLRVQADNLRQPLNVNESTKLELGSTAKLRTLITYLEIVAELHARYRLMSRRELLAERARAEDPLRRWALGYLANATGSPQEVPLPQMLDAALDRRYSANPAETFFTGGAVHVFANFDPDDDRRVLAVREAFRRSVNLVFIRLMRDIVRYDILRDGRPAVKLLNDRAHPMRRKHLERFADYEGRVFLARFLEKYRGLEPEDALDRLLQGRRLTPARLAAVFRTVRPEGDIPAFAGFLAAHAPGTMPPIQQLQKLYERYDPLRVELIDRAFVAGIHPLELWLVAYLQRHPGADLEAIAEASTGVRQDAYRWLLTTRNTPAQDRRIATMLEQDAFRAIHRSWKRLGYPFGSLVPSYATAIGTSGDNPAALAELVGIILNDGMRYPTQRVRRLRFASATPYETVLAPRPGHGERVMTRAVAQAVRRELVAVVESGTGRRARQAIVLPDGRSVDVGGKTGTGDNRVELHGRLGTRDRVLNRTGAFVFFVGDRFFGTVLAYVPGPQAAAYQFTSALPVQVFRALVPAFLPLVQETGQPESRTPRSSAGP